MVEPDAQTLLEPESEYTVVAVWEAKGTVVTLLVKRSVPDT
jgi:hypothetical protein